jgi:hypothetical protein
MSLFFTTHGYDAPCLVLLEPEPDTNTELPVVERAKVFVEKIKGITDLCQANMAEAAQKQEESANRKRTPALVYREGDKV